MGTNDRINDGGPAFPVPTATIVDGEPKLEHHCQGGMSLRDWFAGQALAGLMAMCCTDEWTMRIMPLCDPGQHPSEVVAEMAFKMADRMIAARDAKPEGGAA